MYKTSTHFRWLTSEIMNKNKREPAKQVMNEPATFTERMNCSFRSNEFLGLGA